MGKGILSFSHEFSSSFALDDASLARATPTQVVSEGKRNPKKIGPCIDREYDI